MQETLNVLSFGLSFLIKISLFSLIFKGFRKFFLIEAF